MLKDIYNIRQNKEQQEARQQNAEIEAQNKQNEALSKQNEALSKRRGELVSTYGTEAIMDAGAISNGNWVDDYNLNQLEYDLKNKQKNMMTPDETKDKIREALKEKQQIDEYGFVPKEEIENLSTERKLLEEQAKEAERLGILLTNEQKIVLYGKEKPVDKRTYDYKISELHGKIADKAAKMLRKDQYGDYVYNEQIMGRYQKEIDGLKDQIKINLQKIYPEATDLQIHLVWLNELYGENPTEEQKIELQNAAKAVQIERNMKIGKTTNPKMIQVMGARAPLFCDMP